MAALHKPTIVLDNHKLIDPVEAGFTRCHPEYRRERQLYRKVVLDKYVCDPATLSRLVIFTDSQSDNDLDRNVANEYKDAAQRAGRSFVPVYFNCDLDANLDRIASAHRLASGTGKLTDINILQDIRSKYELFRFTDCPA